MLQFFPVTKNQDPMSPKIPLFLFFREYLVKKDPLFLKIMDMRILGFRTPFSVIFFNADAYPQVCGVWVPGAIHMLVYHTFLMKIALLLFYFPLIVCDKVITLALLCISSKHTSTFLYFLSNCIFLRCSRLTRDA